MNVELRDPVAGAAPQGKLVSKPAIADCDIHPCLVQARQHPEGVHVPAPSLG